MSDSQNFVEKAFSGTGESAGIAVRGRANAVADFGASGAGTVKLQRSLDGGDSWLTLSRDAAGNEAAYTDDFNGTFEEDEAGVLYRWACTAHSADVINCRISW